VFGVQGQLSSRVWRPKIAIKWVRPGVWRPGPAKFQGLAAKNSYQMGQGQGLAYRASHEPGFGVQGQGMAAKKQLSNGVGLGSISCRQGSTCVDGCLI
jgi:hypothetical protein